MITGAQSEPNNCATTRRRRPKRTRKDTREKVKPGEGSCSVSWKLEAGRVSTDVRLHVSHSHHVVVVDDGDDDVIAGVVSY